MYWCRDHLCTISSVVCYILATAVCNGKVAIMQGPENFTASIGGTATFQCEYTGTTDIPRWEIGGIEYASTTLPPQHIYTVNGLHVEDVQPSMNNTKYICVLFDFTVQGLIRVSSDPAYLIVKTLVPTETLNPITTDLVEPEEVIAPTNMVLTAITDVKFYEPTVTNGTKSTPIHLRISAVSDATDPPKFPGIPESRTSIPESSTSIPPHPTETVAAKISRHVSKIYLYIGICIGIAVLSLSILTTVTVIVYHSRKLGRKGEENYSMSQNAAYEVTRPKARVPMITNEAYGISLAATDGIPRAIEAYATTVFAVGDSQLTTEADTTRRDHCEDTIEPYATTTAAIRDMATYMQQ